MGSAKLRLLRVDDNAFARASASSGHLAKKILRVRSPRDSASFRIFSDPHRTPPWSSANCGCSRSQPTSTPPSRRSSRSASLSISPAFVKFATASHDTAASYWDSVTQPAIQMRQR
jgi:hypothetical protein